MATMSENHNGKSRVSCVSGDDGPHPLRRMRRDYPHCGLY